jgi:peptide/nickel transport system permease protein
MSTRTRGGAFWIGVAITTVFAATALLAIVWTPYDPGTLAIVAKLQAPSLQHWLGTDQLGRDELSMLMAGAKNSVGIALAAVLIGVGVGVPLGLLAAARPRRLDDLIMRGNDLLFAFPALLLAILISAVSGPGALVAIAAIGLFNIPVLARVARGAALDVWQRDFCLAARAAGKGPLRISFEHILPNILPILSVQLTIQLSLGEVAEAGLSYLGLGVQPPAPSWGHMLGDAQTLTALAPALAVIPGLALVLFVLGLHLLSTGLVGRRAA